MCTASLVFAECAAVGFGQTTFTDETYCMHRLLKSGLMCMLQSDDFHMHSRKSFA